MVVRLAIYGASRLAIYGAGRLAIYGAGKVGHIQGLYERTQRF